MHPFPDSIVLAMCTQCDSTGFFVGFIQIFVAFSESNLVNCTSLNSLRCVVYLYNRLKAICETSKHLERDKC